VLGCWKRRDGRERGPSWDSAAPKLGGCTVGLIHSQLKSHCQKSYRRENEKELAYYNGHK
jgi:hypothetical protein